jgi:predicted deacylase
VIDVLEGGDVALDFEEYSPSAATTIRIIASIAGNALKGVRAIRELSDALKDLDKEE